jgi:hypothetical protein
MKIKIGGKNISLYKFNGRYELDWIHVPVKTTPSFKFVIDILHDTEGKGKFFPAVFRRESFSIPPTFQPKSKPKESFDEYILVEDTMRDWEGMKGSSPEVVLQKVLNEIQDIFDLK